MIKDAKYRLLERKKARETIPKQIEQVKPLFKIVECQYESDGEQYDHLNDSDFDSD